MAYLTRGYTFLRDTTESVTVPNNDVAKCMYYLNCVCSAIEYKDNDIKRYCNYANWANLSDAEDRLVFVLCLTLSPDEFINKVFFENDTLCGNMGNKFFEIGEVRNHLIAVQSVLIGGQTRSVKKIMAFKCSWMHRNYFEPMRNLSYRFSSQGQREEALRRSMISGACVIS
ncbi:unnamed protein product [Rotaria magnacalcarata]|uniref:Uncharacterized protein n=1 Tax=Rotaria magnacalcarata TaxID=392030 RepID=A0A816PGE4_9BILA|nr:unnamed protein product [Rotaria magnacalcarata]CAF3911801.1 unnamed protein product [Rotaria magnacalcarata]